MQHSIPLADASIRNLEIRTLKINLVLLLNTKTILVVFSTNLGVFEFAFNFPGFIIYIKFIKVLAHLNHTPYLKAILNSKMGSSNNMFATCILQQGFIFTVYI